MTFFSHIKSHATRYLVALAVLASLVMLSLKVEENYPFSHFPMYGNPRADDVDYYFLTDAQGKPLSTADYAGMTAPQIKKRLSKMMKEDAAAKKVKKGELMASAELDQSALQVLTKMRDDASNPAIQPPLMAWPAGVQLKQGLIETTPDGFRESFRTVATLPDAGPATGGVHQDKEPGDSTMGMILTVWDWAQYYMILIGALLIVLVAWKHLPTTWRTWLRQGSGFYSIGRMEAFFIRAGLAYVMWQALHNVVRFETLPHPVGLAHWGFFEKPVLWMGVPENWDTIVTWSLPLLAWYVLGWGNIVPLTILTLCHILQRTLYASQGAPHHGNQMLDLVFLAQTILAWVLFVARRLKTKASWARSGNESLPWIYMAVIIGGAYVITAFEKWDESDGKWLQNSHFFSNQIVKTYRQNYYNDLNPKFLVGEKPISQLSPDSQNEQYRHPIPAQAHWMLLHPTLSKIFFGLGFAMEFTAFLMIFNRALAALYGLGFIAFHFMVLWLMQLTFPLNVEVVATVCLNLTGWIIWWRFRKEPLPLGEPVPADRDPALLNTSPALPQS